MTNLLTPETLVAEDAFLLLMDDQDGRKTVNDHQMSRLLGTALTVDLVAHGLVALERKKTTEMATLNFTPSTNSDVGMTDKILVRAKGLVEGQRVDHAIVRLGEPEMHRLLATRLVDRGMLRKRWFRKAWPQVNGQHEHQVRQRLQTVLLSGADPTYREATLLALLVSVHQIDRLYQGPKSVEVAERAATIAGEHWIYQDHQHGLRTDSPKKSQHGVGDSLDTLFSALEILN